MRNRHRNIRGQQVWFMHHLTIKKILLQRRWMKDEDWHLRSNSNFLISALNFQSPQFSNYIKTCMHMYKHHVHPKVKKNGEHKIYFLILIVITQLILQFGVLNLNFSSSFIFHTYMELEN